MTNRETGIVGESIACDFLQRKGFTIIKRNYLCVYGEIDIIAKNADALIFIEVKTRKNFSFGNPAEAVNLQKQTKIKNAALNFIAEENIALLNFRFDVIEIILGAQTKINHICNAFDV